MQLQYLALVTASSVLSLGLVTGCAQPCSASTNKSNPCASKEKKQPCAGSGKAKNA